MAIVSKTNRDGVDTVIEQLQQKFYAMLPGFWNSSAVYQSYPRANKNKKGDQTIPEISLDKKDYAEVLFNDKFDITSFFLVDNERTFKDEYKQIHHRISLIFQADLVALYGSTERMDETFNTHVLRVVTKESKYIFGDITMIEGVDDVYRDLTLSGDFKKQIDLTDLSNMHVLRCDFNIIYKPNCNVVITPATPGTFVFQLNGVTVYTETTNNMNNQTFDIIA